LGIIMLAADEQAYLSTLGAPIEQVNEGEQQGQ
jgi:hypothetical protein